MSLKYAILGYLSSAPGSGYDLVQQLDGDLGWFWAASHSQIYPELKRLEAGGLIAGAPESVGERLEKRVYTITPTGLQTLTEWASGPPQYRPNRDPERLQLIFSDTTDLEVVRNHALRHLAHFSSKRDRLSEMRDRIVSRRNTRVESRLAGMPAESRGLSLLLRDAAYTGDMRRAELEIAWATELLARLDGLRGSQSAAAGARPLEMSPHAGTE